MKKLNKKEIEALLDEIKAKYYESSQFKNIDRNEMYFMASSTLDTIFIQLLHSNIEEARNVIDVIYPPFRNAFREELVVFSNNPTKNQSINLEVFDDVTFEAQKDIMYNLVQYNVIRNRLEAGYLEDIEINYDEETKLIKTSQETKSALIARYEDAEKYCYDRKSFMKKGSNLIVAYIMGCEQSYGLSILYDDYEIIQLLKEMHFPTRSTSLFFETNYKLYEKEIREIMKFAESDYNAKRDVTDNYNLSDFDLDDYKRIYCCLMTLCLNRTQFCFCESMRKRIIPTPNVIWHKDKIIEFIHFFTSINEEKIKYILETFLVFKNEFQYSCGREYLSIYQPIFDFHDYYVINSSLTLITLAQRKLIWQINKTADKNKNYENAISLMAQDKEKIMISEILSFISREPFNINNNFRFKATDKQNTDVEVDISILDSNQKILFLIECKDHIPIDNEFERNRQDKLLISESEYRAEKNKIILDNLKLYVNNAHSSSELPEKVLSILIANHYGGSNTEKAPIPIISKATFFKLLKKHSYDLSMVYQSIIKKDYKPAGLKQEKLNTRFLDYTIESWVVNNKSIVL